MTQLKPELKIIPAFGRTVYREVSSQVEELLDEKDVDSFASWLESRSIVFKDGRRFDYQTLGEMGYNVALSDDLPRLIDEWEQVTA